MAQMSKWGIVALTAISGSASAQVDLLPDIIVDANRLYDNAIQISGGRTYLRLSNATANIGQGKLHLYGGAVLPGGRQEVIQRVHRSDGTWWDRVAGQFVYHPGHGHIHVDSWCQYSLREVTTDGGVGPVVAQGKKTSFCIIDLSIWDSSLPGFVPGGEFRSCGSTVQGLSVGWQDIYSRGLEGQAIDITDVPAGTYWLESEADPNNNMLESDETNNTARILVVIGGGGGGSIVADAYEENNSRAQVDGRPVGQNNSPNLGPVGPQRIITNLTIHQSGDDDYFKFYQPGMGTSADFVRIDFPHSAGDVDMQLYSSTGTLLATSQGTTNSETITLNNRPAGWYYVRVYGFNGATCPGYTLTIDPSASSNAPTVQVHTPPAGDTQRTYGAETYDVTWSAADLDGNPTWVTVYVNTTPTLDGNEIMLPTSLHTPGDLGFYIINSADFTPGTYWVYAAVTDGNAWSGAWSDGTITFVNEVCLADLSSSADPNDPGYGVPDGIIDSADFFFYLDLFVAGNLQADLTGSADPNSPFYGVPDNIVDAADFFFFLDRFTEGC
ncbi:MAG: pre-peptidase C-terminal domain-containing protein [Phycisphaeraceae bacterium]|nr:pre-peptidase C-terminal domain-containing protein [Phycisphaeraceae bacterium]